MGQEAIKWDHSKVWGKEIRRLAAWSKTFFQLDICFDWELSSVPFRVAVGWEGKGDFYNGLWK